MASLAPEKRVLEYKPPTLDALRNEFQSNLRRLRIFIGGAEGLAEREACQLSIVHPRTGAVFEIAAEAVWIQPGAGIGLSLGLDAPALAALEHFIESEPATEEAARDDARPSAVREPGEQAERNLYDRVRRMSARERDALARQGSLPERVALERCYKSAVWESLLQNPQLTLGEVARIAKDSSLPAGLVAIIVGNAAWSGRAEVQRALLANPRVSGVNLDRVLKYLPRAELAAVAQHPACRPQVKTAAKKLLG